MEFNISSYLCIEMKVYICHIGRRTEERLTNDVSGRGVESIAENLVVIVKGVEGRDDSERRPDHFRVVDCQVLQIEWLYNYY